ncbi:MAG: cobalamin biosynthesis protein CbiD [Firmicutes bacterium]|nr:cobalamin biosynthesis protein CbiD [Bacillota bacterium]
MNTFKGKKLDKFVTKGGKKLRYGYTTGSCAAAAAKAGVIMLFSGKSISTIEIDTPMGWELELPVEDSVIDDKFASCCIVKDSGDDPDVTHSIRIYARVEESNEIGVEITGGEGIGRVTKAGLAVSPGNYAINPAPMKMIVDQIKKVLPNNKGVKVTIYSPEGKEIAKKTFNSRLGIEGGISILGTTGIVEPMSEEAMKESLALEISMIKERGIKRIIFVPGNYGRDFTFSILSQEKTEDITVKTSNYIGYMLDKAKEYGIEEIFIIGHIGKMIKVAGGIFHTHSKMADGRMEILAANCGYLGCSHSLIKKIMESITTDEAIGYIKEEIGYEVFKLIANKISEKCKIRTYDDIEIGTLIFSQQYGELGICHTGRRILEELRNE